MDFSPLSFTAGSSASCLVYLLQGKLSILSKAWIQYSELWRIALPQTQFPVLINWVIGTVILTKYHNFDVWYKILKYLWPVPKKPFFKICSGFLHFWTLSSQKVCIVPYKKWNFFSSNNDSNNVNFDLLVKSASKKSFSQKLFANWQIIAKPQKNLFLDKTFLSALFNKVRCTFLKSV